MPLGMGSLVPMDAMRLETVLTSSLVSSFFILPICLATWLSGTWPSPRPVWMVWTGTLGRMRARRLRSASSRGFTRWVGPSLTRTTPGRPTARNTASCVRGLTATGWSSVIQPRRSVPRAAPEAPGWFSICANAARSARRDRMNVAASRPSGIPMIKPVIQPETHQEAHGHDAEEHQKHQPRNHGIVAAGHGEDLADLLEPAGLLGLRFLGLAREQAALHRAGARRGGVAGVRGFRHSASILRDLNQRAGRWILPEPGPMPLHKERSR